MRRLRILVVDDDADNASSLGELFELEGHWVKVANSGEDAIAAYLAADFDIAFMDVMMPGLNGVESFLEIRRMRPEARVFMMTGYSVEQLIQQALDHGAMGVLPKPLDVDRLLHTLRDVGPLGVLLAEGGDARTGRDLVSLAEKAGLACGHVRRRGEPLFDADAIAIIDTGLPLIGAVDICRELRQQGHARPAIIVTPFSGQCADTHEALRDISVTGVLSKPFDPMQLLATLETLAVN
jgi:two-component system, NtrC family, response regulator HydG